MTQDLDRALEQVEGISNNTNTYDNVFEITVKNMNSESKTMIPVLPENTLEQVFNGVAGELGLDKYKTNNFYINDSNESTTDGGLRLREFGIKDHSMLRIQQDGKVAADG